MVDQQPRLKYLYTTDNRALPFALRLFISFLPCLVDILFKKPCVLALLSLLG